MASSVEISNKHLQCPICLERYKNPRCLPNCLHSFCEDCISSYASSILSQKTKACPICRTHFTAPTNKDAVSNWSKKLPLNYILASLMDEDEKVEGKQLCGPCNFRNEKSEALHFCTTCKEAQCGNCKEVHRSSRITKSHIFVEIDKLSELPKVAVEVENMQYCSEHTDKQIEFYCSGHTSLICSTCAIIKHRKCDNLVEITEICDKHFEDLHTTDMLTDMLIMKTHVEQMHKTADEKKTMHKIEIQKIKADINKVREKFNTALDAYEKQVIKNVEKAQQINESKLSELSNQWNKLSAAIETSIAVFHEVVKHGTKAQIYVCHHKTRRHRNHYKSVLKEEGNKMQFVEVVQEFSKDMSFLLKGDFCIGNVHIKQTQFHFPDFQLSTSDGEMLPDTKRYLLPRTMQSPSGNDLEKDDTRKRTDGDLLKKEKHSQELPESKGKNKEGKQNAKMPSNNTNIQIEKIGSFTVQTPDDQDLWFGGATFLADGRIVFTDAKNHRLVVLDENFAYESEVPLSSKPRKVVRINEQEIAVTLFHERKICFFSTSEQLWMTHTMYVNSYPYMVVPLSNNELLVSSTDAQEEKDGVWTLDILSRDGTLLDIFQTDKSSRTILKAYHIAIEGKRTGKTDKENYRVIQSCQETQALYCFLLNGTPQFEYKIQAPTGVDFDFAGNIYVCNHHQHEIHVLSSKGNPLKVFRTAGLNKPLELRFNAARDTFLVTQYKSATVHVFTIYEVEE